MCLILIKTVLSPFEVNFAFEFIKRRSECRWRRIKKPWFLSINMILVICIHTRSETNWKTSFCLSAENLQQMDFFFFFYFSLVLLSLSFKEIKKKRGEKKFIFYLMRLLLCQVRMLIFTLCVVETKRNSSVYDIQFFQFNQTI